MDWIIRKLSARAPDVVIGKDGAVYMRRWWIIPKNPIFNIYLHQVCRDDHDVPHDHPAWNLSLVLRGGYIDRMLAADGSEIVKWCPPGTVRFRWARQAHRLELPGDQPSWSLWISGPKLRTWGFHCPNGWVPANRFFNQGGCD